MDGFEFDRRTDSPILLPKPDDSEKYAYNQQPSSAQTPQTPVVSDPGPPNKRFCVLRSTTFILSAALAVTAVLATIAAGVGGSLVAKGVHYNPNTLIQPTSSSIPQVPNDNPNTVAQPTSSSVPQVPNDSLCPTVNSKPNSTTNSMSFATNAAASIIPTSDCDKLANKMSPQLAHIPNSISTANPIYLAITSLESLCTSSRTASRPVRPSITTRPIMGLKGRK